MHISLPLKNDIFNQCRLPDVQGNFQTFLKDSGKSSHLVQPFKIKVQDFTSDRTRVLLLTVDVGLSMSCLEYISNTASKVRSQTHTHIAHTCTTLWVSADTCSLIFYLNFGIAHVLLCVCVCTCTKGCLCMHIRCWRW